MPNDKRTRAKIERLYKQYQAARERGHMGTAVRLLTRINRLENGETESGETEPRDPAK